MGQPTFSKRIDLEFDRLRNLQMIKWNNNLLGFLEKARTSLESPRILERRDIFGRSLLHYAAMGGCTDLLLYLLQKKPNIDSRDMHGRTPLSWAAEYSSLAAVKILLDHGATINARDYESSTPLAYLLHAGNPDNADREATKAMLTEKKSRNALKKSWIWILSYFRLRSYVRSDI